MHLLGAAWPVAAIVLQAGCLQFFFVVVAAAAKALVARAFRAFRELTQFTDAVCRGLLHEIIQGHRGERQPLDGWWTNQLRRRRAAILHPAASPAMQPASQGPHASHPRSTSRKQETALPPRRSASSTPASPAASAAAFAAAPSSAAAAGGKSGVASIAAGILHHPHRGAVVDGCSSDAAASTVVGVEIIGIESTASVRDIDRPGSRGVPPSLSRAGRGVAHRRPVLAALTALVALVALVEGRRGPRRGRCRRGAARWNDRLRRLRRRIQRIQRSDF